MNNLIKSQLTDFKRQFQHLHTNALNDEHFKMAIPNPPNLMVPGSAAAMAAFKRHSDMQLLEKLTKVSMKFVPAFDKHPD